MAQLPVMRIYFEDEAPRIGCGSRTVSVKIGRKWVYFTDTVNGNRQRLPKEQAESIIRSTRTTEIKA